VLRIRLTRTGKRSQESFRIVVAEHTSSVKGKYIELLGNYKPATSDKDLVVKKDRIQYWISKGAKPSESVASLLKKHGVEGMDQYMVKRTSVRKKKKGGEAKAA
jgi:small subunit ribosomal protein S16